MDTTEYTYTPYTPVSTRRALEGLRRLLDALRADLAALEIALPDTLEELPAVEIGE
jgi:hypothetical protein